MYSFITFSAYNLEPVLEDKNQGGLEDNNVRNGRVIAM